MISYNTREETLAALRSVQSETRLPHEIIVVDNASTDGSAEAIAEAFPWLRLLAKSHNLGFAAANNVAAHEARGEYLLLLNPDTVTRHNAVDRLVAFADSTPDARIWTGRTTFSDGRLNPGSCFRRMSLWTLACGAIGLNSLFRGSAIFNSEHYGGWKRDSEREIDIAQGSFFLIRREDWEVLGGFDTAFFMYGEETDLCLRARKQLGARPRFTPAAEIVHLGGASEAVRSDKMVRLLKAKQELITRHFPKWQQPIAAVLLRGWPWSRQAGLRIAARLTGRDSLKTKAATWKEIHDRREEWRDGFS